MARKEEVLFGEHSWHRYTPLARTGNPRNNRFCSCGTRSSFNCFSREYLGSLSFLMTSLPVIKENKHVPGRCDSSCALPDSWKAGADAVSAAVQGCSLRALHHCLWRTLNSPVEPRLKTPATPLHVLLCIPRRCKYVQK